MIWHKRRVLRKGGVVQTRGENNAFRTRGSETRSTPCNSYCYQECLKGQFESTPWSADLPRTARSPSFFGSDNYYSHRVADKAGQRLALATLMANGHARSCQIQQTLCIASGRITKPAATGQAAASAASAASEASTKSRRSHDDAHAAEGLGTTVEAIMGRLTAKRCSA